MDKDTIFESFYEQILEVAKEDARQEISQEENGKYLNLLEKIRQATDLTALKQELGLTKLTEDQITEQKILMQEIENKYMALMEYYKPLGYKAWTEEDNMKRGDYISECKRIEALITANLKI